MAIPKTQRSGAINGRSEEEVFETASAIGDAVLRAAYLERECSGDPALLDSVRSLLDAHEEQERLSQSLRGTPAFSLPDTSFGKYRPRRLIGRGGMGAVYLADRVDGEIEQTVAIKILDPAFRTPEYVDRFLRERRMLAALDHPCITRVIDAGVSSDGQPFLVMEYVEGGEPVTEYAAAGDLSVRERLGLFRQICNAVEHAHRHLVIHRDLKPGNVLVNLEGRVKLLDFGLAKLLEAEPAPSTADATQTMMLTPRYASPEQLRGEAANTQSDVYALGLLLYELLTERHPYPDSQSAVAALERAMRGEEIPLPAGVAADLAEIVRKAAAAERGRRYGSVWELAADVDRFLEGRPVSARPATLGYRLAKYLRRNALGVAASGLLALTLAGGVFATVRQRNRAERRFEDVRSLANSMVFRHHDAIENLAGSTPARQLLVRDAIAYLDKLSAEAGGDKGLLRELALAYIKIGDIQGRPFRPNLGDTVGALRDYGRGREILEKLDAWDPEAARGLSAAHERIGTLHSRMLRHEEALDSIRRSLEIRERMAAAFEGDESWNALIASSRNAEGYAQWNRGRVPEALAAFASAHRYRAGACHKGGDRAICGDAAKTAQQIGHIHNEEGRYREAALFLSQALETFEREAAMEPSNADVRRAAEDTRKYLCDSYAGLGEHEKAMEGYARALRGIEALSATDPSNIEVVRDQVYLHGRMAKTARDGAAVRMHRERAAAIVLRLWRSGKSRAEDHTLEGQVREYSKLLEPRRALEVYREVPGLIVRVGGKSETGRILKESCEFLRNLGGVSTACELR